MGNLVARLAAPFASALAESPHAAALLAFLRPPATWTRASMTAGLFHVLISAQMPTASSKTRKLRVSAPFAAPARTCACS